MAVAVAADAADVAAGVAPSLPLVAGGAGSAAGALPVPVLSCAHSISILKCTLPSGFLSSLFTHTTSSLRTLRLDATLDVDVATASAITRHCPGLELLSLSG